MKKLLSIFLALCLLFSMTACGGEQTGEQRRTRYVVTSKKSYREGEVASETVFTYDQKGRPLTAKLTEENKTMEATATYDEQGNRIKETFSQEENGATVNSYEINYNLTYENGRVTHCDYVPSYKGDATGMGFDLEYDEKGNLVYVEYNEAYTASLATQWHLFEYDSENRLSREFTCHVTPMGPDTNRYTVSCDTYRYEGNAVITTKSVFYRNEPISREDLDSITLTAIPEETYTCFYDDEGNLIHSAEGEATYDGDKLSILEDDNYTFDEHGNLLSSGTGDYRTEYTYEAIELTDEEWENAKQLMHGGLSTIQTYAFLYFTQDPIFFLTAPLSRYFSSNRCPVYYLVPYPLW